MEKLLKNFGETQLVDTILKVYVDKRNGHVEKDVADRELSLYEQFLYELFKNEVEFNLAFDLEEEEADKIFDGNYSVFYINDGYSEFDGQIRITKDFSEETINQMRIIANKCYLKLIC